LHLPSRAGNSNYDAEPAPAAGHAQETRFASQEVFPEEVEENALSGARVVNARAPSWIIDIWWVSNRYTADRNVTVTDMNSTTSCLRRIIIGFIPGYFTRRGTSSRQAILLLTPALRLLNY
jgi:hypothetical protein